MHKRTLDPIKTMIYGLRRYDLDRCMALANLVQQEEDEQDDYDGSAGESGVDGEKRKRKQRRRQRAKNVRRDRERQRETEKVPIKVRGYFSYKAKVYLVRTLLSMNAVELEGSLAPFRRMCMIIWTLRSLAWICFREFQKI